MKGGGILKKRKTYEISIIDKTYSKTISDETKFFTSDTALELGFELKETEYTFESAEIVLLNIDDRSLVTRPVTKSLDSFTYELDDDITAHYGEWRGQIRFEQAGETYVSSPVKFRIENDLSNERPPQLSDVQSWVSLKRYADSLTEELKQAVLSVDELEVTFNANEATRQTNETTRQNAEIQRESAESSRVSAEAQRKIDHTNRSAELADKADKKQEDWITPTLLNGATSPSDNLVGYFKDTLGFVHFKGRLSSYEGGIILILPVGYRPSSTVDFPTNRGSFSLWSNGELRTFSSSGNINDTNLVNISFRAER